MRNPFLTVMLAGVLVYSTPYLPAQATLGVSIDTNGTVTQVATGSAAQKAGLQIGDTITGLNNHPIQGASEITSTLGKTHPRSLLPVTIRRNGHPQTLLVFPTAAAGNSAVPNAGVAAQTGHYNCFTFTFMAGGLGEAPSSLGTGIDLLPGSQYVTLRQKGAFHADTNTDRLVFETGPLARAFAHLQHDTNGNPKIMFVHDENRQAINGHEIDRGPTACYLK